MDTVLVNMSVTIQLVEEGKKGVERAYEELYKRYVKAMFNISLRITNDSMEAEDIIQESFLSAFKKMDQLKDPNVFGGWLKRIVINKSIDFVKKKKERLISFDDISETDIAEDENMDEENGVEYDVDSINRAVKLLPDGFRTVITLYLFEDYSHKEIAEMMGISESTSKTQYLRAKKKLISLLGNK